MPSTKSKNVFWLYKFYVSIAMETETIYKWWVCSVCVYFFVTDIILFEFYSNCHISFTLFIINNTLLLGNYLLFASFANNKTNPNTFFIELLMCLIQDFYITKHIKSYIIYLSIRWFKLKWKIYLIFVLLFYSFELFHFNGITNH